MLFIGQQKYNSCVENLLKIFLLFVTDAVVTFPVVCNNGNSFLHRQNIYEKLLFTNITKRLYQAAETEKAIFVNFYSVTNKLWPYFSEKLLSKSFKNLQIIVDVLILKINYLSILSNSISREIVVSYLTMTNIILHSSNKHLTTESIINFIRKYRKNMSSHSFFFDP